MLGNSLSCLLYFLLIGGSNDIFLFVPLFKKSKGLCLFLFVTYLRSGAYCPDLFAIAFFNLVVFLLPFSLKLIVLFGIEEDSALHEETMGTFRREADNLEDNGNKKDKTFDGVVKVRRELKGGDNLVDSLEG